MRYYQTVLGDKDYVFIIHPDLLLSPYYASLSIIDNGYPARDFLRCTGGHVIKNRSEECADLR